MRFGAVPLEHAEGAVLAHSCRVGAGKIAKGVTLGPDEVARLQAAGVKSVTVARLEPGDIDENAAAARLARALVPAPEAAGLEIGAAFTGRANLIATGFGVLQLDVAALSALNRIDPAITLATLAPLTRLEAGTMAGTVKIITYAVEGARLDAACEMLAAVPGGAMRRCPVRMQNAGLVLSEVPGQPAKLSDKAEKVTAARLAGLGMTLAGVRRVRHDEGPIAAALAEVPGDLVLLLTGSATSDAHDVGPEAVRMAGGHVSRFGMPVDPGNLLFLGSLAGRPVLGLPGCARSPALNGADWVLERIACGLVVTGDDIAAMGVGGLLKEIPIRPQPRRGSRAAQETAGRETVSE